MPRLLPALLLAPLIHGAEVMLHRFEHWAGLHSAPGRTNFHRPASLHGDLVNLPSLTEHIAANYDAEAENRSVHLFVDVAPDAIVLGDSSGLRRVIDQLVAATLERTPDGGGMTISGDVSQGVVKLTFCGFGLDHPVTSPPTLCSANASANGPQTKVARMLSGETTQLVQAWGGRLETKSSPGPGACVVVSLPVT